MDVELMPPMSFKNYEPVVVLNNNENSLNSTVNEFKDFDNLVEMDYCPARSPTFADVLSLDNSNVLIHFPKDKCDKLKSNFLEWLYKKLPSSSTYGEITDYWVMAEVDLPYLIEQGEIAPVDVYKVTAPWGTNNSITQNKAFPIKAKHLEKLIIHNLCPFTKVNIKQIDKHYGAGFVDKVFRVLADDKRFLIFSNDLQHVLRGSSMIKLIDYMGLPVSMSLFDNKSSLVQEPCETKSEFKDKELISGVNPASPKRVDYVWKNKNDVTDEDRDRTAKVTFASKCCKNCGCDFKISHNERRFYEYNGLDVTKKCSSCRSIPSEQIYSPKISPNKPVKVNLKVSDGFTLVENGGSAKVSPKRSVDVKLSNGYSALADLVRPDVLPTPDEMVLEEEELEYTGPVVAVRVRKPVGSTLDNIGGRNLMPIQFDKFDIQEVSKFGWEFGKSNHDINYIHNLLGTAVLNGHVKEVEIPAGVVPLLTSYWAYLKAGDRTAAFLASVVIARNLIKPLILTPEQQFCTELFAPLIALFMADNDIQSCRRIVENQYRTSENVSSIAKSASGLLASVSMGCFAVATGHLLAVVGLAGLTTLCALKTAAHIWGFFGISPKGNGNPVTPLVINGKVVKRKYVPIKPGAFVEYKTNGPNKVVVDKIKVEAIAGGIVVPNFKPVVCATNLANEVGALDKRVLAATPVVDKAEFKLFRQWVMTNFNALFPGRISTLKPEQFLDWLSGANCTPTAKKMYLEMYMSMIADGTYDIPVLPVAVVNRLVKKATFLKKEFVLTANVHGDEEKAARLIQGCRPEYIVYVAPWAAAFNGLLKNMWNKKHFIFYASGSSMLDVGNYIGRTDPLAMYGEDDVSSWDASFGTELSGFEIEILKKFGLPTKVEQILKADIKKEGYTRFGHHYSVDGTRASGVPLTSAGNSMMNGLIHAYLYSKKNNPFHNSPDKTTKKCFIKKCKGNEICYCCNISQPFLETSFRCAVLGDDNVFAHTGKVVDWKSEMLKFGFKSTAKYSLDRHISFCSSWLVPTSKGYSFVPKVGRLFSKMGWSLNAMNDAQALQYCYDNCKTMFAVSRCMPPLRAFIDRSIEVFELMGAKAWPAIYKRDEPWRMSAVYCGSDTSETWAWLYEHYGWTVGMQHDFEVYLKTIEVMPFATDHPFFELFCEADTDGPRRFMIDVDELCVEKFDPEEDLTRYGVEPNPGPEEYGGNAFIRHTVEISDDISVTTFSGLRSNGSRWVLTITHKPSEFVNFGANNMSFSDAPFTIYEFKSELAQEIKTDVVLVSSNQNGGLGGWLRDLTEDGIEPNPGWAGKFSGKGAGYEYDIVVEYDNEVEINVDDHGLLGVNIVPDRNGSIQFSWFKTLSDKGSVAMNLRIDQSSAFTVTVVNDCPVFLELPDWHGEKSVGMDDLNLASIRKSDYPNLGRGLYDACVNVLMMLCDKAGIRFIPCVACAPFDKDVVGPGLATIYKNSKVDILVLFDNLSISQQDMYLFKNDFSRLLQEAEDCDDLVVEMPSTLFINNVDGNVSQIPPTGQMCVTKTVVNRIKNKPVTSIYYTIGLLMGLCIICGIVDPIEAASFLDDTIGLVGSIRSSGWVRDLTMDGIEPNPGPEGDDASGALAGIEKAQTVFLRKCAARGLSREIAEYIVKVTDPFHDIPLPNFKGAPVVDAVNCVVHEINDQITISKPASIVTSGWDAHVVLWPWPTKCSLMYANMFNKPNSAGGSWAITPVAVAITNRTTISGGLCVYPVARNAAMTTAAIGDIQQSLPDVSFFDGEFRPIAAAFEVRSVGANLYRAGSQNIWRIPTPPMTSRAVYNIIGINGSGAITVGSNYATTLRASMPPSNSKEALLVPTTITMAAQQGCYVVARPNSVSDDISSSMDSAVALSDPSETQVIATTTALTTMEPGWVSFVQGFSFTPAGGTIQQVNTGQTVALGGFDMCGSQYLGLNDLDTLTINVKWVLQRYPTQNQTQLVTLARPPPVIDEVSRTVIGEVLAEMGVGVEVRMNSLGGWFEGLASTIGKGINVVKPLAEGFFSKKITKVMDNVSDALLRVEKSGAAPGKVSKELKNIKQEMQTIKHEKEGKGKNKNITQALKTNAKMKAKQSVI